MGVPALLFHGLAAGDVAQGVPVPLCVMVADADGGQEAWDVTSQASLLEVGRVLMPPPAAGILRDTSPATYSVAC